MGKPIIDDELWALIEPLLPPAKPRRFKYPGRKPMPDRAALTGILFVLKSGIRWRDLPAEMGAAPVSAAGEGCAIGNKLAYWIACTQYFWRSCEQRTKSTCRA
ncbi:transposase [Caballeronia sp. GAFFF1]|uniref:transposase n=1 Tax=Caballeronia sp. GAFFF1 TaxID=2921779 RepID=UPI0032EE35A7